MKVSAVYEVPIFESVKIARASDSCVKDDVLKRLYGLEDYVSNGNFGEERIFKVQTIKNILDDPEDDTNETTKCRLEDLYRHVKGAQYLFITT